MDLYRVPFLGPLKKYLDGHKRENLRQKMKGNGASEVTVNALDTYVKHASKKGGLGDKLLFGLWTLATLPAGYYIIFHTNLPVLAGYFFFLFWASWGYVLFWDRFKEGRELRSCLKNRPEEIVGKGEEAFDCELKGL